MTRLDPHSPSNLVTEDYSFAYAFDGHPREGDRAACVPIVNRLVEDGWHFASIHDGDSCDHCGARLRYVAVLKHAPTRTLVKVGETCLDNRFDLATADFHRLRQQAKLNRERTALAEKREAFHADPRNARAVAFLNERLDAGDHGYEGFYFDLLSNFNRYGSLTERQVDAVHRAIEREAAYAARKAAEAALPTTPVIEGRIPITGTVLSVKWQENGYGGREVMTVRDDRGFKVWGSTPSGVTVDRGNIVAFVATVTKSDRDESFGFFKRPTKAEVLNA